MIAPQSFRAKASSFHPPLPILCKKNQSYSLLLNPKCFSKPLHESSYCSLNTTLDTTKILIPRTSSLPWNITIPPQILGLLTVLYPDLPWTETLLSTLASLTSQVILPALIDKYVPHQFKAPALSTLQVIFDVHSSSILTLVIEEYNGQSHNEIFEASLSHLCNKINPSADRLRVSKSAKEDHLSVSMEQYNEIIDVFEEIQLKWKPCFSQPQLLSTYSEREEMNFGPEPSNYRSFELSFDKKHKDKVICSYLPYILSKYSNSLREKTDQKVVKIHTLGNQGEVWKSRDLDHPATFDTMAMDPELKRELMEDLDRFVRMREFYGRVGKAWKRGYLLYGPPGTGKTSMICAMANYLKLDIYDLNLASVRSDSELRSYLLATKNKSILAFEDIDCSTELHDRTSRDKGQAKDNQVTLSGLLNLIDGLWPSCGDERIIIFTTNRKDCLEPALLRPGRMDMHIHMSHCTPAGFKILASKYHSVQQHPLLREIEELIERVDATPAEICEQLMKSEDIEIALRALIGFLQEKKMQVEETKKKGN